MMTPKMMCSPPKPPAKNQFARYSGQKSAAAPSAIKQSPITGTMLTENMPPVTTPVPYNSSQTPGITSFKPARNSTAVSNAPANSGGDKLKTTLRPGPESSGMLTRRAFRSMDQRAIKSETDAAANHTASHPPGVACSAPM